MTRAEHLEWAKKRAIQYVDAGELDNAVASMGSDLEKHLGTKINFTLLMLGALEIERGPAAVRRWVEGFR